MSSEAELYILLANNLLDRPNFVMANLFLMEGRKGQVLSNGGRRIASSNGLAGLFFMMDAQQWGLPLSILFLFLITLAKTEHPPAPLLLFSIGEIIPHHRSPSLLLGTH